MSVVGTDVNSDVSSDSDVGSDVSKTSTPPSFVPLSFDDGDVILRAGSHGFKVHVALLRLASPVFSSMFSLPQPPIENDSKPPVSTIEMDDDPWALDVVLRWIYPLRNGPVVPSMEKALSVYLLADKLDVGCAVEAASKLLSHYLAIEGNPLRSWAISLHYGLEEARVAEKRFVTSHYSEIVGRPDELAYVNGLQYFDLLDARKKAWAAMREAQSTLPAPSCCSSSINQSYQDLVQSRNPFSEDVCSEELFHLATLIAGCNSCRASFNTSSLRERRQKFRNGVNKIVKNLS